MIQAAAGVVLSSSYSIGVRIPSAECRRNQTQAGSRTFSWDLANRLRTTSDGGTTLTYSYDGLGKRVTTTSSAGTPERTYLWDVSFPLPELALERDGAAELRRYLHGHQLISMTEATGSFYYQYDGLGSVTNVTSQTGATQWTYQYEPLGTLLSEVRDAPTAPDNAVRFTGEHFDLDTGLYHLRARQYDAEAGRFLSTDPLETALADPYVSAYIYVNDRPTVLIDPSGMKGVWRIKRLGLALFSAADAGLQYGMGVGVAWICGTAMRTGLVSGPVAVGSATPACATVIGRAFTAGYLESRAAGSHFYDFLHPEEAGH